MPSETERITNEVLNRRKWEKLEDHLGEVSFDEAQSKPRTTDELRDTKEGFTGTGEALLDFSQ